MSRDPAHPVVRQRPDVEVVRLVRVTYLMGWGEAPDDPVRRVEAYFDLDGVLVFEDDPARGPALLRGAP